MIHIFTTGGSMDKTYSTEASDFVVGEPAIEALLREVNIGLPCTVTPLLRRDSLDLTDADRAQIVQAVAASPHTQIVITHGTDTLTQTAAALGHLTDRTIVLTGAMQPYAFKVSDAAFNAGAALAAVQVLPFGVYIVMSGLVLPWEKARKNHTTRRFEAVE